MYDIQIISAPSILGLKPTGVQDLAAKLLSSGLAEELHSADHIHHVQTLNHLYNETRDTETQCLNPELIKKFSLNFQKSISEVINNKLFPVVLGGDCSILLGIMPALKKKGTFGLIFIDAHGDFYLPEQSTTGEVADMDLAIVTGRGPDVLTDMDNLKPYVKDENVIHIAQRDWEETKKFGSHDIRDTKINCIPMDHIEHVGIEDATSTALQYLQNLKTEGFWIHFDLDALSDDINPAVDYRLPGGLTFQQSERLIRSVLLTGKIVGMSVTIFNPRLDADGTIANNITESLGHSFNMV